MPRDGALTNPFGHSTVSHLYAPRVFMQKSFGPLQFAVPRAHSSRSEDKTNDYTSVSLRTKSSNTKLCSLIFQKFEDMTCLRVTIETSCNSFDSLLGTFKEKRHTKRRNRPTEPHIERCKIFNSFRRRNKLIRPRETHKLPSTLP